MTRTLILLRHGKSEYPAGVADHDRPLAHRGHREASLAGEWIRANAPVVDAVLCSSATRTRETLAAAAIDAPTSFRDELYAARHLGYLDEIRAVPGEVSTLLVVGHEPSVSETALALARHRDSHHAREMAHKYPTSGIAVLEFAHDWADLELASGHLAAFEVPR